MKKLALLALVIVGCHTPHDSETRYAGGEVLSPAAIAVAKHKPDFVSHIKPVLEAKCVMCHNRKTLPGHMSLENGELALKPGSLGVQTIVPGHPEASLLIANIAEKHAHVNAMPAVGERMTKNEIAILSQWIKQGATWPTGRAGKLDPRLVSR